MSEQQSTQAEANRRIVEAAKALLAAMEAAGRADGSYGDDVRGLIEFFEERHDG